MALTIRDLAESDVERFKTLTGKTTATGALVKAAQIGVTASQELAQAKARIAALELQLRTHQQAMRSLSQACVQVTELAAQTDLFEGVKTHG